MNGRWSFDDVDIGFLDEGASALRSRCISRPPGLRSGQWYAHAALVCEHMNRLPKHFERMQEMAARYLEPGPYVASDGIPFESEEGQLRAFVSDMIYMLDGPEQRKAQYGDQ